MNDPCPSCGGTATRQGTKGRTVLDPAEGGMLEEREIRVQRWRCTTCARFFTTSPDIAKPRSLASIAARDAIAAVCMREGCASAAERHGVDERTARALWMDWAASRQASLVERPPEFMGLHVVRLFGADRTVITNVEDLTVVEVLADTQTDTVTGWLEGTHDAACVRWAAVAVNPSLRQALRTSVPHAVVSVCPGHAAAAGTRAFLSVLRGLRRSLGAGRNAREGARLFAARSGNLSERALDEMSGWSDEVIALYQAKEAFVTGVMSGQRDDVRSGMASARATLPRHTASRGAMDFLKTWEAEVEVGAVEPALRPFEPLLDDLTAVWGRHRPQVAFEYARGRVLLDGEPLRGERTAWNSGAVLGRSMAELLSQQIPAS